MSIGDRLKYLREQKDVTQIELAKAIGTTKQNIYKYENNIITNIPSDKIELIAIFFNVSPSFIMGWESKQKDEVSQDKNRIFTKNEILLLENFNQLNEEGQGILHNTAVGLVASGQYKKSTSHEMDKMQA